MDIILQGARPTILENLAIVSYAVICLTLLAIAAGWVEQRAYDPDQGRDSGDESPEPPEPEPEPTTPSHGSLPDIEPAEVMGQPYLPALPLWASDNREARQRADVARFRERSLGTYSTRRTA